VTLPNPLPDPPPAALAATARRGLLRRLYDWVLHWADTPYATPALFLLSLAESSFFPIPPDVLLIALCLGERHKAFRFAFWCSVASVLGGILGYGIGAFLWETAGIKEFFFAYVPGFTPEVFYRVRDHYEEWNFWIVFVAAFTPIPYKVITITAGVCGIGFPMFLLASAVGRSARFYLVAWLLHRYGAPIQRILDRYLGIITLAIAAVGILGFLALKYVF
jgi:membrane protein YqaA with SNARE-associated domain